MTEFSDDSRRRMDTRFAESDWPQHRTLAFITLTWPRYFSSDPHDWKRALAAWRRAYERRWGPLTAIWALEFQRRGAPHFHLAIAGPKGVAIDELREWSARAWYRIAGHGDERHLRQHQKPEHCKKARTVNELERYLLKELDKKGQKELPQWLRDREDGAGRWWGMWRLQCAAFDVPISSRDFTALHRVGRRVLLPRRRKLWIRGKRWVIRPRKTSHDPWRDDSTGEHWTAQRRAARSRWRPDSRWLRVRDRSSQRWALKDAFVHFWRAVNDEPRPRLTYAQWDDVVGLGQPTLALDAAVASDIAVGDAALRKKRARKRSEARAADRHLADRAFTARSRDQVPPRRDAGAGVQLLADVHADPDALFKEIVQAIGHDGQRT